MQVSRKMAIFHRLQISIIWNIFKDPNAGCIAGLHLTEDNYSQVLDTLVQRYVAPTSNF